MSDTSKKKSPPAPTHLHRLDAADTAPGYGPRGVLLVGLSAADAAAVGAWFGAMEPGFAVSHCGGDVLEGTVRLNRPIRPVDPVKVRLSCMERVTANTNDGRSTRENLLWQHEEPAEMDATGDTFPVAFALPADARATTTWNGNDGVFWRLEAQAKLPGVDYKTQFELPVCEGELSPEEAAKAARAQTRELAEVAAYVPPAASRVRITTPLRGGPEFYFPPGRSFGGTLIMLALLSGMGWWINVGIERREWGGVFALGVVLIILVFILTYMWTSSVRVSMDAGMVTVTQKFLGIPTVYVVAAADVLEIRPDITANTGSSLTYGLKMVCRDGKNLGAGDRIRSEREAQWLAARMLEAIRKS